MYILFWLYFLLFTTVLAYFWNLSIFFFTILFMGLVTILNLVLIHPIIIIIIIIISFFISLFIKYDSTAFLYSIIINFRYIFCTYLSSCASSPFTSPCTHSYHKISVSLFSSSCFFSLFRGEMNTIQFIMVCIKTMVAHVSSTTHTFSTMLSSFLIIHFFLFSSAHSLSSFVYIFLGILDMS